MTEKFGGFHQIFWTCNA